MLQRTGGRSVTARNSRFWYVTPRQGKLLETFRRIIVPSPSGSSSPKNANIWQNKIRSCSTVHLEKLTVPQPVKKFPAFYGTRRFIIAFTSSRQLSVSWGTSIQSMPPHLTSWWSILILSSHLLLVLQSDSFHQVSAPKPCMPLSFPPYALHALPISVSSILSQRRVSGEGYRSFSSSLCSLLEFPVTSSLLDPNILLNTLSLRSSLNVSDQFAHPYKTTDKIIVLYILIFKFLDSKLEDKRFCTEWWQAFPDQYALNCFLNWILVR